MPQMDGITFLRALRQQAEPTGSIPALVTSSEREAGDIETARAAGANFYLVKPVSQETLAVCAYMGGGPTLMYAAEAVRAYEEFTAPKA